jgi:hypothetical protein
MAAAGAERDFSGTVAEPRAEPTGRVEQLACDFGHEHGPTVGWWLRWQQRRDALHSSSVISSTLVMVRDHRGKPGGVPGGERPKLPEESFRRDELALRTMV